MACFGGGGSAAKAAQNITTDPQISTKPFLEVTLTMAGSSSNPAEKVLLVNTAGEFLPGLSGQNSSRTRPPK